MALSFDGVLVVASLITSRGWKTWQSVYVFVRLFLIPILLSNVTASNAKGENCIMRKGFMA